MQKRQTTVAIIGAGPSGIACAQQCIRQGLEDVVLVESERSGGLLYQANRIENFPGLRDMSGREAVEEITDIIQDHNMEMMKARVSEMSLKKKSFESIMEDGTILSSTYLVLATGTQPKTLNIPGEIYHPEWRDYTQEKVVVIGGGDAAYDYALRINDLGGEVIILQRGEPRALYALQVEVGQRNISVVKGEVSGCESNSDKYLVSHEEGTMECDTVVVAIGREPCIPKLDFHYKEVVFPSGATDVEGFYTTGSLILGGYRHASLAWGTGLATAMDICKKDRQKM